MYGRHEARELQLASAAEYSSVLSPSLFFELVMLHASYSTIDRKMKTLRPVDKLLPIVSKLKLVDTAL